MHKNWLIIKREYLSRVKKRSFIIMTLLVPIIIIAFVGLEVFIFSGSTQKTMDIAVIDESGLFKGHLKNENHLHFTFLEEEAVNEMKQSYESQGYDGFLYIPDIDIQNPTGFTYFSTQKLGFDPYLAITDQLNSVIRSRRMLLAGIDQEKLKDMKVSVTLFQPTGSGSTAGDTKYLTMASSAVGYVSGFLIYFALILFGTQVMRGVAEEKTNRISEIMVSSVRPFQLMIGKIVGIGAVGLTQFIIWILMAGVAFLGVGSFLPDMQGIESMSQAGAGGTMQAAEAFGQVQHLLYLLPVTEIILCFFFYFFGGYLFYSALFAAVGSAVDQDMTESQSLTLPITMPIIISFIIMFSAIQQPNSGLSVFCSIFPFSSPMVMMARIPYGVPAWQLILSMVLLVLGFLFTTWMAGKIYRTGILMYGKKVTLKELTKWAFRRS